MLDLPLFVSIVFGLTTLVTVLFFYFASQRSRISLVIIISWILLQSVISIQGFFVITNTLPPRFLLLVLPPVLTILLLFFTTQGRSFIDKFDLKTLTLLHVVRIPVELVLFWLFMNSAVPELMTFEGRNPDILSGLTAPVVYYLGFVKKILNRNVILAWNFICLGLLINIVTNAVLSAPSPFQQFAFDQPNIGVLYFPFVFLPGIIVPIVLFSHLVSIRRLIYNKAGV